MPLSPMQGEEVAMKEYDYIALGSGSALSIVTAIHQSIRMQGLR